MTRKRPWSSMIAAATLTECFGSWSVSVTQGG
jgi:hypothetical protein